MSTETGVPGTGPNSQMRHGFESRVTRALAGVEQYLPATSTFVFNEKAITQPEIVKALQDHLQLFRDLRDLRTQAAAQLKRVHSEMGQMHALYLALEKGATAYFGKGNPKLAQFGYALGLRKPSTAATNVKAQAKAQLTRALRHTMGSRQKAAIRADAPSTVTVSADGTVQPVPAPSE